MSIIIIIIAVLLPRVLGIRNIVSGMSSRSKLAQGILRISCSRHLLKFVLVSCNSHAFGRFDELITIFERLRNQ